MVAQIRPSEFHAWRQTLPEGTIPVLLDVRESWELQTSSVPVTQDFALRAIPMHEIPERIAELNPAHPVACLCHHGARSQRVALFLAHNGFEQVVNIAGGIDAWAHELDPGVARY